MKAPTPARTGVTAPEAQTLDNLVRLYAESVATDLNESTIETFKRRVELHDRLCDALKVNHDDFIPFELAYGCIYTPAMCERMIRLEIQRVKS